MSDQAERPKSDRAENQADDQYLTRQKIQF